MKKACTLVVLLLPLLTLSCHKKDKTSKDDLPRSIKDYIASSANCQCEPSVDQYTWNLQKIYTIGCKGPACNCAVTFLSANGEALTFADSEKFAQFKTEVKYQRNIWRCSTGYNNGD